jgi:hypothetical protein
LVVWYCSRECQLAHFKTLKRIARYGQAALRQGSCCCTCQGYVKFLLLRSALWCRKLSRGYALYYYYDWFTMEWPWELWWRWVAHLFYTVNEYCRDRR